MSILGHDIDSSTFARLNVTSQIETRLAFGSQGSRQPRCQSLIVTRVSKFRVPSTRLTSHKKCATRLVSTRAPLGCHFERDTRAPSRRALQETDIPTTTANMYLGNLSSLLIETIKNNMQLCLVDRGVITRCFHILAWFEHSLMIQQYDRSNHITTTPNHKSK
jgi:hypothetical protein